MNFSDSNTSISEAHLWRYFAGQATSEEKNLLTQWVKMNDSHKAEFQRVKELFYNTKFGSMRQQFDGKKAFNQFKNTTKTTGRSIAFRPWMAVAAMITVLLGTGVYFITHRSTTAVETSIAYQYSASKASYTLPDRSFVQLNKHSHIQYQTNRTDKRVATLTGEAFFDIQHNPAQPFEIAAGAITVRVLGTAFDINAQNKDSVFVSVTRGKVMVTSQFDSSKKVILNKGQSACFVRNSFTRISESPRNVLAWKERIIHFDATPMTEVVRTLQNYFDTTIVLDSKNRNQQLTVQLKEPKLDSVLQLLQVMYNLKTTTSNGAILLKDNERD